MGLRDTVRPRPASGLGGGARPALAMIDIHCHILPGVDDGAATVEDALAMAAVAAAAGTKTIVATPHVRDDHPFPYEEIPRRVAALNEAIARAGTDLEVVAGAEVALTKVRELDDQTLAGLTLGDGSYLLVESPYTEATDFLEHELFALQVRGFRPVLAHPERSPSFMRSPQRLGELVGRGMLCSVTDASLAGQFGSTVRRLAVTMFREGLVHDIASDAHDTRHRPPRLTSGIAALERDLAGAGDSLRLLTVDVPAAILAGEEPPPVTPHRSAPGARGWRRILGRR